MMHRRILYQDYYGTVRYEGPILHEDKGQEIWVGIEWDDVERGKHNGTVGGFEYFKTSKNQTSGSLLKREKVSFGVNILDAIFLKYFKEIPKDLHGILDDEMINMLKDYNDSSVVLQNLNNGEQEETKDSIESKTITVASQKQVLVEFDSNAYFETFQKKKKMVEFYGFDEIWKKIMDLKQLKELSLMNQYISMVGRPGFIRQIMPTLRILSLEQNLIYSWHQVFQICSELTTLYQLSLAGNVLEPLIPKQKGDLVLYSEDFNIFNCDSNQPYPIGALGCAPHIEILILIGMKLNWEQISQVLPAFRNLSELLLCRNDLTDYENLIIKGEELSNLTLLNLEATNQTDFSVIQKYFGKLPRLEKLLLNRNNIKELCQITEFKTLNSLSIEFNLLDNTKFLSQLADLPNLSHISIKHNPVQERLGREYMRQRATAEIGGLQFMNGSQLTKFERKDGEIFYLKSAFEEYFIKKKVPHYYYDYNDFLNYCKELHPRIPYLINKFGNPFEIDPTVKGEFKQQKVQNNQKYIEIKLVDKVGKLKDKPPTTKKFMTNTGIFPIKQVVSRLMGIPLNEVQVSIQVSEGSEIILMNEKDKTLADYEAQDNSIVFVEHI